jgi:hypothetical protein
MEIIKNFADTLKRDLGTLINDIQRIITKKEKEEKEEEIEKSLSTKNTIMSVTNLYENKKEIEILKEDPDVDFIVNAIDHIFGKNL